MGPGHGRVPVGVVADGKLADPRLAGAAVGVEGLQEVVLRFGGDDEVRVPAGERAGAGA